MHVLPGDLWERVLRRLGPQEWAAAALACRGFHAILSSSRFFFNDSRLLLGGECSIDAEEQGTPVVRQLGRVGPALHRIALAGGACCPQVLSRLPSLRLLKLQDPALGMLDSACWLALGDLHHLAHLHLDGVRPPSGLGALRAATALRVLTIKTPSATGGLVEELASGLAALGGCAVTRLSLTLPEYADPLDAALGCLTACRSLSLTVTRPPVHGGAPRRIRPAGWAAMQLAQLALNLAGDSTHIEPGLSHLTGLQRLSVVGAAERSPADLWAAGGHALEQVAFAGTGGLPPVPDCLDAQLPRLRSLEASYGALDAGLFPPALCTLGRQLTLLDLFNAGLENTRDCPATLPDAFSQLSSALRQLSLARNFLEVLPPPVLLLTNLTFLSLWGNRLEDLPAGGYLSRLQHLNLATNRLTQLPAAALGACGADTLQKLGLASNPIAQLCAADACVLGRLASLQVLGLGGLGTSQQCHGRTTAKCGAAPPKSAGPGSDLEVALLWLMALQVPRCSVSFDPRQFTTRFCLTGARTK